MLTSKLKQFVKCLLVLVLSLSVSTWQMPHVEAAGLAFGAVSAVSTVANPTSVTVSGSNTVGYVFSVSDSGADNVTAITWGGVAMTRVGTALSDRGISVWGIVNPASAASIVITGGTFHRSYSWYYTGASQLAVKDSANTGTNGSATVLSIASTVVVSNAWFVMAIKDGGGGRTDTPSGVLASARVSADGGGIGIADSNGIIATGSQTGTITISGTATALGGIAFSVAPVAVVFSPWQFSDF